MQKGVDEAEMIMYTTCTQFKSLGIHAHTHTHTHMYIRSHAAAEEHRKVHSSE